MNASNIKLLFFVLLIYTTISQTQAQIVSDTSSSGDEIIDHFGSLKPAFHYPGKQFFLQGEIIGGFAELGGRVAVGYRFSQFGILGIGLGVDIIAYGPTPNISSTDPYSGMFFPLYIHYEGDVLKKRITPAYSLEAGYAFRYSNDDSYITVTSLDHPLYKNLGGFTGSAAFGVKIYGRRRVPGNVLRPNEKRLKFYSEHKVYGFVAAGLDVKQAQDKYSNYYVNSIGENIRISYSSSAFMLMPVIKVVIGF